MSRKPSDHLSEEEMCRLTADSARAPAGADSRSDLELARVHANICDACNLELEAHRSLVIKLAALRPSISSTSAGICPEETVWFQVVTGLLPDREARVLIQHASSCETCGPLLKEATEDLTADLKAAEKEFLRGRRSSGADWQRTLAAHLAKSNQSVLAAPFPVKPARPVPSRSNWLRWAASVAALLLVMAGAFLFSWRHNSRASIESANRLLAQAYTINRPFLVRFPEAQHSSFSSTRGPGTETGDLGLRKSAELLDAEFEIAKHLQETSTNPGWLDARVRADLLAGQYSSSIDDLRKAQANGLWTPALQLDLATSFFARAQREEKALRSQDYQEAERLLQELAGHRSTDPVVVFNLAVVIQSQQKFVEAEEQWRRYLNLDSTSEWATEARTHLEESQSRREP